jgi:hypothetical protein
MDAICGANYMWVGLIDCQLHKLYFKLRSASQFTRLGYRFQDLSTCAKNIAWNIGEGRAMFGMSHFVAIFLAVNEGTFKPEIVRTEAVLWYISDRRKVRMQD